MLQQAWLSEEAALWQYVLNCEHGILTLGAVRTEQMFAPRFWCGILQIFYIYFYNSSFGLIFACPVLLPDSLGHQMITEILDMQFLVC